MKYCGNGKPYIYVSFEKEYETTAVGYMDRLRSEGVLFWYADKINKRELRHIEGACAVLLFVSQKHFYSEEFHKVVNQAVRCNKKILTVYTEDVKPDAWGHMQLGSAQSLSVKAFADDETFYRKLSESEIFENMQVTPQQMRFKRNTAIASVLIPLVSAALIFNLVVYPLLIAPAIHTDTGINDIPGMEGLTQEELDQITELNMIGDQVYKDVSYIDVISVDDNGQITYRIGYEDGHNEEVQASKGRVSELTDLPKCRNLKVLRICENNITDVSPLALMPQLEIIGLSGNPISSIEDIEALENVQELSLNCTDISDLKPIENWKNLSSLSVGYTYVDELPDSGVLEGIDYLSVRGSLVTSIPYLGEGYDKYIIADKLPSPLKDFSFLEDVNTLAELSIQDAKKEDLLPYLAGIPVSQLHIPNTNITSLEDLSGINMRGGGALDVCHTDSLTSLEGFGPFQGLWQLNLKGCNNLKDVSQIMGDKNCLFLVVISHSMPESLQDKIKKGRVYEVEYQDD